MRLVGLYLTLAFDVLGGYCVVSPFIHKIGRCHIIEDWLSLKNSRNIHIIDPNERLMKCDTESEIGGYGVGILYELVSL